MRKIIIWAVVSVGIKLLLNHLLWSGMHFVAELTGGINFLIFLIGGFLASAYLAEASGVQLALVAVIHFIVFATAYVSDYYEWTARIADEQRTSFHEAVLMRDDYLRQKGHSAGAIGYMGMTVHRDFKSSADDEIPDDTIAVIVWAIPRGLQWISKNWMGLHIDGAIAFVYWYIVSLLVTALAPIWVEAG